MSTKPKWLAQWLADIRARLANVGAWLASAFPKRRRLTARMRVGNKGEDLATRHLRGIGHRIITRNWRHGRDEIDIVSLDGATLVFVEVKTQTLSLVPPPPGRDAYRGNDYYAVDTRKRRALLRAFRAYLRALRTMPEFFRFDIIEVALKPDGTHTLNHYKYIPIFTK